jgi:hypothetical protein
MSSNLKGRLDRLVGAVGLGEPFRQGAAPGDFLGRYSPFKPGFDPLTVPRGFQKLAMLTGLVLGLHTLFGLKRFREDPEDLAKAQKALGLTGDESPDVAVEHCLALCRDDQFNRAEMLKAESLIRGTFSQIASDASNNPRASIPLR